MIPPQIQTLIESELVYQDTKWGKDRVLAPVIWLSVLGEEFGEVCRANLEGNADQYVAELVDLAASAIAALQSALAEKEQGVTPLDYNTLVQRYYTEDNQ